MTRTDGLRSMQIFSVPSHLQENTKSDMIRNFYSEFRRKNVAKKARQRQNVMSRTAGRANKMFVVSLTFRNELRVNYTVDILSLSLCS